MENIIRLHPGEQTDHVLAFVDNLAGQYNFKSYADRLHFLHTILVAGFGDISSQLQQYLYAGVKLFTADLGWISDRTLSETEYHTVSAKLPSEDALINCERFRVFDEKVIKLCKTIVEIDCQSRIDGSNMGALHQSAVSYIGTPVKTDGAETSVLAFVLPYVTGQVFDRADIETIELMAEGVAKMSELQKQQLDNRFGRSNLFATPGVKPFEDYIKSAEIPEVYGVPGRVVEVLKRRIGKSSLAIDYIAEELNLSKRTLQRRLQQQSMNFAQLRDQVRYHYSIDYLIEHNQSIDSISSALDFSDRTSFTNAFKRWTGLSPSTFRKLFRDYV